MFVGSNPRNVSRNVTKIKYIFECQSPEEKEEEVIPHDNAEENTSPLGAGFTTYKKVHNT